MEVLNVKSDQVIEMEIDNEILRETTLCRREYNCIQTGSQASCKVEKCINNIVHFVNCPDHAFCNYKSSFGSAYICACPTRKEIYRKFGM